MTTLHSINIGVHVLFGTVGLLLGLVTMLVRQIPTIHARFGRYFLWALAVVGATGLIGSVFFRSNGFLLMLTLAAGYEGYSGYRIIHLRERRTVPIDALIAIGVLLEAGAYTRSLNLSKDSWSPAVIYPTLGALALVAGYDLLKRYWLFERLKTWWLYEHIYKMMSAYSAILSAFSGTVFPQYKPYSQILPSVLSVLLIVYFIVEQVQRHHRHKIIFGK